MVFCYKKAEKKKKTLLTHTTTQIATSQQKRLARA